MPKAHPKCISPTSMLQTITQVGNQYQVIQLWCSKIKLLLLAYYLNKYEALPYSGRPYLYTGLAQGGSLRLCNHPAQSKVKWRSASQWEVHHEQCHRQGRVTNANLYNNNDENNNTSGTQEFFPVPRDTLRISVSFAFRHIHTVPMCSSSAEIIIYARVLCSFPLATDSMPASLILGPTCTMLIHTPTRYPFCVAAKCDKHWIWKPPITYTNPLFASV